MPPLADRVRRAPLGVLLIASLLAIVGVGSLGVGVYLALSRGLSGPSLVFAAVAAAASLYLGYHLVALAPWARLAALILTALLLASSIARFATDPDSRVSALLEIAAELATGAYLARPRIRNAFAPRPTRPP